METPQHPEGSFQKREASVSFDDPGVKLGCKVRMVLWRKKTKNKAQDVLECATLTEKSCLMIDFHIIDLAKPYLKNPANHPRVCGFCVQVCVDVVSHQAFSIAKMEA